MGDLTERSVGITALAVRQGEGCAGIYGDHITIVIGRDAVTVQAEGDIARDFDACIKREVSGQAIAAGAERIAVSHKPLGVTDVQLVAFLLDFLGKDGRTAFRFVAAAVAGAAPAEVVGVPVTQFNLSVRLLKTFAANIGNKVIGGVVVAHFGIPAGGERLIAIIAVQSHADLRTTVQMSISNDDDRSGLASRSFGQIYIAAGSRFLGIVRDFRRTRYGERAICVHIYAATVSLSVVAADFAAGQSERAHHIHTAAVFGTVGIGIRHAANGATGHRKIARLIVITNKVSLYTHATAMECGIAGDAAVIGHIKCTVVVHKHTTTVAVRIADLVAGDSAAAHGKRATAHIHTAAILCLIGVIRSRAADAAAGHGEF